MKVFSFKKKKQADSVPRCEPSTMLPIPCQEFLFRIDQIFSIHDIGTAVVGVVLNGSAGIGDTVSFGHVPGEVEFTCKIKAIDGKDSVKGGIRPVERAAADDSCRYGCSLILDELDSYRFWEDAYMFISNSTDKINSV